MPRQKTKTPSDTNKEPVTFALSPTVSGRLQRVLLPAMMQIETTRTPSKSSLVDAILRGVLDAYDAGKLNIGAWTSEDEIAKAIAKKLSR